MQSFITCQSRAMPSLSSVTERKCNSLARFISAMVLPEAAAISSISFAVWNG